MPDADHCDKHGRMDTNVRLSHPGPARHLKVDGGRRGALGVPMTLRVAGLWRYPVKSLAGEPLLEATLTPAGIPGDRVVHVRGPEGVRTSRRHHRLLGLHGTLGPDARPRINGHPWDSAEALVLIKRAAGDDAWLEAWEGVERFDILPLLVATDGAVAAFGRDVRRLRPNILVGGVEGMAERLWEGARLRIGDTVVRLAALRGRCPMTTVDPDTLERDPAVLKDIGRRFGGRLALDADVERGGAVRVEDDVVLDREAGNPHDRAPGKSDAAGTRGDILLHGAATRSD